MTMVVILFLASVLFAVITLGQAAFGQDSRDFRKETAAALIMWVTIAAGLSLTHE